MLKNLRLQSRTMVLFGCAAVLVMGLMMMVLALRVRAMTRAEAFDKCGQIAQKMTHTFNTDLTESMSATRALAAQLEAVLARKIAPDRGEAIQHLMATLQSNPFFFGIWFQIEPNLFDGRDTEFAGKEGYSEDGSMMPYVVRAEGGTVDVEDSVGLWEEYKNMDYFTIPIRKQKECIIEPYIEPDANNVLMTSTCVPIYLTRILHLSRPIG